MKRKLLLLFVCLFGALGGVKAYTVDDLTTAGWTLINNLDDITNNVYVFVDAGSSNYIVTRNPSNNTARPQYMALTNPFVDPKVVWTIESRATGEYALRNVESQKYFNTGNEGWNDGMEDTYVSGNLQFISNGSKYDLKRVYGAEKDGWYVGPWGSASAVNINANPGEGYENIAANKKTSLGFYIYKMAKATYLQKFLQQCPNVTSPVEASYLIVNPTIYQANSYNRMPDGWGEYNVNSDYRTDENISAGNNSRLKIWKSSSGRGDYYQTIAGIPNGLYRLTAAVRDKNNTGKVKPYIMPTGGSEESRKESTDAAVKDESDRTTEYLAMAASPNNSVNIGMHTTSNVGSSTVTGDNFRMSVDPYLRTMATEFNNGVEMTAGLWYHFTVANTGKHVLTATNLNDIIYATGSETALSAAGSSKFSELQTLSANIEYYIRSSSNNTLTITPCISTMAEELPDNGEMTAGDWYYFDVATAGHYDVVATSLANIVYTTNGELPVDASVASKFSVKNNELSATRYYVKSSSAQTLQWFLTDPQNYSSRMSSAVENWTGVGTQTPKQAYPQNTTEGVETYNSNDVGFSAGDILYQTINDLPNGNYEVSFYAWENFCDWNPQASIPFGDNIAQVFANTATKDINVQNSRVSSGWVDANKYTLNCHVTNGTLVYGVKNIATGGNWAVCRPISLTYTGPYNEVVENTETRTQTYEGTFTEDVDFTPTAECPIVDITGASFTGNIDVSFAENPNGLIIATSAQKIELNYLKEDPVKNIISTKDNLSDKVVITDGYPFVAPFDFQAQEARYSRTVGASTNFGTICVPFALTSNGDIQYYTTDQITGGVLKLTEVDNVAAGTPAIFKKKNSGATSISVHKIGTAIEKDAGSQGENVRLVGKFERYVVGDEGGTTGTAANGNYFISSDVFYEGADYIIVKPFRAYLETVGVIQSRLTLQIDDETTAINELKTLDEKQGLKDGKYLIGGKIIVVKEGKQYNVNGVIK